MHNFRSMWPEFTGMRKKLARTAESQKPRMSAETMKENLKAILKVKGHEPKNGDRKEWLEKTLRKSRMTP
jgi:phage I-like protein